MDLSLILLYALAVIGPIMIFLTHYIVKGRGRDMTRLWFITFFSYMIYYWLAKSNGFYNDPNDFVYGFALLWPIAAILSFWITELLTKKGRFVPFFEMMVAFLVSVVFAFVLDGIAGIMNWYTYNTANVDKTWLVNPIGGLHMPSLVLFMLGVLMIIVFFLVFNVHKELKKRRIDETSATLLLAFMSVILGGALWVVTDFVLKLVSGFV
ncbi:conserved hypothetical protein [Methanocella paludicola SANAE]|uniref:Uncharacterized protein n=1 Tax=Methanocella paludicola (strain DSM 17711 / JCM 13418 / NBRC 101707 / SANAE) TaxID=304371 RepID=D1Z0M5_METPS|nr:hypothetical protein [Methanocella paludicola]BAI62247.1 conserved hypothetical protein [Methanocella paludicola SANAE]